MVKHILKLMVARLVFPGHQLIMVLPLATNRQAIKLNSI